MNTSGFVVQFIPIEGSDMGERMYLAEGLEEGATPTLHDSPPPPSALWRTIIAARYALANHMCRYGHVREKGHWSIRRADLTTTVEVGEEVGK